MTRLYRLIRHALILILYLTSPYVNSLKAQSMQTETKEPAIKAAADSADRNNNFYDNTDTYSLPRHDVVVAGEVENPGTVDFSKLPVHSVIVKETVLTKDGKDSFVGAYRYDGYSLFDILCDRILKKKNAAEFRPIIDLYVEIENSKGEKVILSWGEIYYPNFLHNSILATIVSRIVPSKTKDLWPLPKECKLVIANDLITERNISDPVKITVRSYDRSIPVNRDIDPLYSGEVKMFNGGKEILSFKEQPKKYGARTVHTIFYGRGRGIHSTQPFTGIYLKELLGSYLTTDAVSLKTGMVVLVGRDGYRSAYSFSEIMNRNDQSEVLLVPCEEEKDGGKFRIFPACDFFSDRAVKALTEIRFTE
jgi:hypothetical protein